MGHKAQLSADVVTNVAFGLAGVFLTIFMICQAARYTASRNHYQPNDVEVASESVDLEELQSPDFQPLPEPVQQDAPAVTNGAEVASPPTAILRSASQCL